MDDTTAIQVWNRACELMDAGASADAREGDLLLMHAIALDGAVQANGVVDALESSDAETGIAGMRWLGLREAAELLDRTRRRLATAASDDDREVIEEEANTAYYSISTEEQMTAGLAERLRTDADEFLPL